MNKFAKRIGIATLVVALLCNLQYSLFFSVKDNPGAAKAAWTDMYGTVYCGNSPDTGWYPGEWIFLDTTPGTPTAPNPNDVYDFYGYLYGPGVPHHIWYFVRNNTATSECGPNETATDPTWNYKGYYITAPDHPTVAY
jgi:hypothetical protein